MRKLAVVGCLVMVGACSSGTGSHGDSITLYSGQHEQTTATLVKAFAQQSGVNVQIRSGDEDALASQLQQEGSHSPADVFYTENSAPLAALDEKGLLAPADPATLAAVPAADSAVDGHWVGVSARVSELVYNTSALSPAQLPKSVLDLAGPAWKGKVAIAPSETDFQPIVTSVAKAKGSAAALAWLNGLKSNASDHTYPDNESLVAAVNGGQAALGIINHYYWYRLRAENGAASMHSALATFAPGDPGYVVDISGAAVLKSSSHQAEAQKLLDFLVSHEGQTLLAQSFSYEYPVVAGIAANPALPPFSSYQPAPLTVADIGDGSTAVGLLEKAQLE